MPSAAPVSTEKYMLYLVFNIVIISCCYIAMPHLSAFLSTWRSSITIVHTVMTAKAIIAITPAAVKRTFQSESYAEPAKPHTAASWNNRGQQVLSRQAVYFSRQITHYNRENNGYGKQCRRLFISSSKQSAFATRDKSFPRKHTVNKNRAVHRLQNRSQRN